MLKRLFELSLFALLGTLLFVSKILMEFLPNIHLITMLIIVFTVVFGWKAIFPVCTFVFLSGLYAGFQPWWVPYLYIWLFPYLLSLAVPKKIPIKIASIFYIIICALHGFLFGTLYAPSQAIMFGLDFKGMCAWIITGIPYDIIHGLSNAFLGLFIMPVAFPLKKVYSSIRNIL